MRLIRRAASHRNRLGPPLDDFPHIVPNNVIDTLVFAKLKRLNVRPSELCADEVFLRRAYLDAIGTLPSTQEVRDFLADHDPAKRRKLIDRILNRPEYADYWGMIWADLFTVTAFRLPARTPFMSIIGCAAKSGKTFA